MSRIGAFDETLLAKAWFDATATPEGWFVEDAIQATSGVLSAAVSFTASGTLSSTSALTRATAVSYAATGILSSTSALARAAAVSYNATGTLTATGRTIRAQAVAFQGTGTFAAMADPLGPPSPDPTFNLTTFRRRRRA